MGVVKVGMAVGMVVGVVVRVEVTVVGETGCGGGLLPAAANGGKRHRFEFLLISQSKAVLHGFIQQLLALIRAPAGTVTVDHKLRWKAVTRHHRRCEGVESNTSHIQSHWSKMRMTTDRNPFSKPFMRGRSLRIKEEFRAELPPLSSRGGWAPLTGGIPEAFDWEPPEVNQSSLGNYTAVVSSLHTGTRV